ncbi:MAG: type V CRISPR-associated protein Cas12a/Cpf1, partial [Bacteriovoracales bacterium]|nr:type V CRISPR-associated protein Cas12a/Cpf1 [Bacteriovoracales bacterium]
DVSIIGIDRGERHLAYYSVLNPRGQIVDQGSLNSIERENKNDAIDYAKILERKGLDRDRARKTWGEIQSIKNAKEGYLSLVIPKIFKLMLKHNAIVVFEDLNFGFKRGRFKIEKQVYQKIEKAMIDKLNFLILKDKKVGELASFTKALQLTAPFESFQKIGKQTGFIYYVPAHYTSKICPKTGFVNLLYPKYETVKKTKEFIKKFDRISFNEDENYFEFHINYERFSIKSEGKKDWVFCTYGDRLERVQKDRKWISRKIGPTDEFANLLVEYDISFKSVKCIKEQILILNKSSFFKSLIKLIRITLQIRNSDSNNDEDWILSPVKDKEGNFFDSRTLKDGLAPDNADANGAYHIALKGLLIIHQLKNWDKPGRFRPDLAKEKWFKFVQDIERSF